MGIRGEQWQFGQGILPDTDTIAFRTVVSSAGSAGCQNSTRRGAFAARAFKAGESICKDETLAGASCHLPSNQQRVKACEHCYRYLGTVQVQFEHLSGGAVSPGNELPGMNAKSDCFLSQVICCKMGCGAQFCSSRCATNALRSYHRVLCCGKGGNGAAVAPYLGFKAHAKSENEAFIMAARMIAQILSLPAVSDRNDLSGKVQRLCAGPWWDLVTIPDDVPEKKHKSYRGKLKATATRSHMLLKEVLSASGFFPPPVDASYLLEPDFYGMLLGAILQNSICIELPSPARQYLEAQITRGSNNQDLPALAPIAQGILQRQARLQAEEEADDTMSLGADDSSSDDEEEQDSSDEDRGSSERSGDSLSGVGDGFLQVAEGVPQLTVLTDAAEAIPDLEASGIFPTISFLNHSCEPNVSVEFMDFNGLTAELVAACDIEAGEELFISYIENDELETASERQKELLEYGFQCECPRCSSRAEASTADLQRDGHGKRPTIRDEEVDAHPPDLLAAGAGGSSNTCKRARPQ